jgi:heat shock protein HslJ
MKNYRIRIVVILFTIMITALIAQTGFACEDRQLEEDKMEVTGLLSLSVLEGSEWILTRMSREQPVPEDAEVTIAFNSGRISGKSACNRYSADIKEGDSAGEILIGPTMGTRMACPDELMEIERHYLDALSQVTDFSFHAGSLALNGQTKDGTRYTMLFVRTSTDKP